MQLIWGLVSALFVLWLIGLIAHVGGPLIHVVLVAALVLLAINVLTDRGARA
jgi:hypothetical protein